MISPLFCWHPPFFLRHRKVHVVEFKVNVLGKFDVMLMPFELKQVFCCLSYP